MQTITCRVAPSLGDGFAGTAHEAWGTKPYDPQTDNESPCVFFGLYGLPDFFTLWRHKGIKWILWAGSDIRHFREGYWLDEKGSIRISPSALARWIRENCESWVENEVEREALAKLGIESKVCPSFLGNVYEYDIEFTPSTRPKVYASVSGDDFDLYRWHDIEKLAAQHPDIEFHLYGNTKPWKIKYSNVFVHGRVSQQRMNDEIKHMQGALRLLPFDGFSEVLAKSILWGQWPISTIHYPHMLSVDELGTLSSKTAPNLEGRDFYQNILNKYPWNARK